MKNVYLYPLIFLQIMKYRFIIYLILLSFSGFAQLYEDFSDGELLQNPTWQGDLQHFIVNTNQTLQLNNQGNSDTSYLATAYSVPENTEWSFYIHLAFSPSSKNFARVYLTASDSLLGAAQGFYLQFGESGSNDAIELFWKDGNTTQSICRTPDGSIAQAFALYVKVKRYPNGQWQIWAHPATETTYQLWAEGSSDNPFPPDTYFALQCTYTKTNAKRFYFDDIIIQSFTIDTIAPQVEYVMAESSDKVRIIFSEVMNQAQLNDANHFEVQGMGVPQTSTAAYYQQHAVLSLLETLVEGTNYLLNISGLEDIAGNRLSDTTIALRYIPMPLQAVQINELMPDPVPPVNLPAEEYIELHNRSALPLWLQGWQLYVNDKVFDLPPYVLAPDAYMLLCDNDAVSLLSPYGHVFGVSGFNLPNAGANLSLYDANNNMVQTIDYTKAWYHDANKDDGGWSLAQINPDNICGGALNWQASVHEDGGSPGQQNAHWATGEELPHLSDLKINDNTSLQLTFNQQMQLSDLLQTSTFTVDNGIGQPFQIVIADTAYSILLLFQEAMQQQQMYNLHIDGILRNCMGQPMIVPIDTTFMLNKIAEVGDIVINEIMTDPIPSQGLPPYEYIELYNRSNAPIALEDWFLYINDKQLQIPNSYLLPQEYLILCTSDAYNAMSAFGNTVHVDGLLLPNTQAGLTLVDADGQVIHHIRYKNIWHTSDKQEGGWSLEMADAQAYCIAQNNWYSSVAAEGGTPGTANSVQTDLYDIDSLKISGIYVQDSLHIRLQFNSTVDNQALVQTTHYNITPDIGEPISCQAVSAAYQSVEMTLGSPLKAHTIYTLSIEDDITDCVGNNAKGQRIALALPQAIDQGDVVINEILFDATRDKGEYIELVNRSDKVIALEQLAITYQKTNVSVSQTVHLHGGLLFPHTYIAYSAAPTVVQDAFYTPYPQHILALADFPHLSAAQGELVLHVKQSVDSVIDQMHYHEDMHYSLLNSTKGVALENIDYHLTPARWHSAASTVGFGTPAYQNSQYQYHKMNDEDKKAFSVQRRIFSPDNDGVDDILRIQYKMPDAAYRMSAKVFTADGVLVKQLYDAELLGTEGEIYWDGTTEDNNKANVGVYVVLFEYFNLQGNKYTEKMTVVVAAKW